MGNLISAEQLMACIGKNTERKISEKEEMFEAARLSIVCALLNSSYYAIGISIPSEETLIIRAKQISEKFDCGNVHLKSRFMKAVEIKGIKDLRTPITVGDLTNADRILGEEGKTSCYKRNGRLPSTNDKELWTEEMVKYAIKYEQRDLELLMRQ